MRYPDFLPKGGRIGFVAPSFGCATEPYRTSFNNALETFREMSYQLSLGENCYADRGVGISNSPEACGRELNRMYMEEAVDAILSCGGGELMCEVVPFIDFKKIAQSKPRWYMGYSDNTNFTFLSATISDTAAVYGPCAPTFGMQPWHPALFHAMELLSGTRDCVESFDLWEREGLRDEEHPLEPYHVTEPVEVRLYVPAVEGEAEPAPAAKLQGGVSVTDDNPRREAEPAPAAKLQGGVSVTDDNPRREAAPAPAAKLQGRLIGGCLDCLSVLVGTRFDQVRAFNDRYREDGIIWFLESCDLNLMGIRRALWQMKEAGWFDYVKGFIIGRPLCFGSEEFGIDHYRAVTDALAEYQVPIIMDADIGHLPPMMPMVCGATAVVEAGKGKLRIRYTWK